MIIEKLNHFEVFEEKIVDGKILYEVKWKRVEAEVNSIIDKINEIIDAINRE